MRLWLSLVAALLCAAPAVAQEQVQAQSLELKERRNVVTLSMELDAIVPWRVFTLADPYRAVVDFKGLEFAAPAPNVIAGLVTGLRIGALDEEWSRMVLDLSEPIVVDVADMRQSGEGANLSIRLVPTDRESYLASVGAPEGAGWQMVPTTPPVRSEDRPLLVAIDAGHGGIDPGAERDGVVEAHIILQLAKELAETLDATGEFETLLTRSTDIFIPLSDRMTIARAGGADVFISLHADALDDTSVSGASVYTLSSEAIDKASEQLAERLNRADLLAGVDLTGQDDTVAVVLMELARRETGPASERLADAIVDGWKASNANVNSKPHRHAALWVLNAADYPSLLIEAGFLSNAQDRVRLDTVLGRREVITGIVSGLRVWARSERALRANAGR